MKVDRRSSADEESRFFVLLNTLTEARIRFAALAIDQESHALLDALIDRCRAEFNARFR